MQEEEEENLAHFEMTEQAFDVTATSSSSSSVQTPVISQVSSTMNYDSRPSASMAQNSPGSRAGHGTEEGTAEEEPKNAIAVTSLPELEREEKEDEGEGQNQKKALVSITIEWEAFHLILLEFVYVFIRSCGGLHQYNAKEIKWTLDSAWRMRVGVLIMVDFF